MAMLRRSMLLVMGFVITGPSWAQDSAPFIYGEVTKTDGEVLTGFVRWGKEEVLWTDHFNGTKLENAGLVHLKEDDRTYLSERMPEKVRSWNELAAVLNRDDGYAAFQDPHDFAARFGDLQSVKVLENEVVELTFRDGQLLKLQGGSNDIGARVAVHTGDSRPKSVRWRNLSKVVFMAAPEEAQSPFGPPMFGRVDTKSRQFTGQVQWDLDERVGADKLQGFVDGQELTFEFSEITSIEKQDPGSFVVLKNGESHLMTGTNDVDGDNRGIIVTVPDMGRATLSWSQFEKVTFEPAIGLPAYEDFGTNKALAGRVKTDDGQVLQGDLIFNLDREFDFEMLGGRNDKIRYMIAFRDIKRIQRRDGFSADISLRNGQDITLANSEPVSDKNDGVILLATQEQGRFLPWRKLEYLEID